MRTAKNSKNEIFIISDDFHIARANAKKWIKKGYVVYLKIKKLTSTHLYKVKKCQRKTEDGLSVNVVY